MRKPFWVVLSIVVAAAVCLWMWAYRSYGLSTPFGGWQGFAAFALVGLVAQIAANDFGSGRPAKSSMAFVPFITGAIVFRPAVAVLAAVLAVGISALLFEKRRKPVTLFNLAQTTLSVGGSAFCYTWISGSVTGVSIDAAGFAASALCFFGVNILTNSAGLAALHGLHWPPVLRQMVGPLGANLWYDFLASPFAVITAVLYRQYNVIGIAVIVLPLFLFRHSYSKTIDFEKAIQALLQVLVKAIETRDPYTKGHSIRVATLAKAIALDFGLSRRKAELVEWAALLHDIGKIDAVYAEVIQKPHALSADERQLIRTHANHGADLLESLSTLPPEVIKAVRYHHERYDGQGYPDGLQGGEIPLPARIIMICDSIDAMLSDRPYRKALALRDVHSELERCKGTQFDPAIVETILTHNTLERAAELVSGVALSAADSAGVAASRTPSSIQATTTTPPQPVMADSAIPSSRVPA
ncbi:MAG: HD-GYP domain-containing protein [Chloroflexi bacterium]|nr:HD-GYP domain-containing protein [Chloroflexota bacterium]